MRQTVNGPWWYFAMKVRVEVGSRTKVIHTVLASPANLADCGAQPHLLRGLETRAWVNRACQDRTDVICQRSPRARVFINRRDRHYGRIDEPAKVHYHRLMKNSRWLEVRPALTNLFLARRRSLHMAELHY